MKQWSRARAVLPRRASPKTTRNNLDATFYSVPELRIRRYIYAYARLIISPCQLTHYFGAALLHSLVALSYKGDAGERSRPRHPPHSRVSPRPTFHHLSQHHTPLCHPARGHATRARQSEAREEWRIFGEIRSRVARLRRDGWPRTCHKPLKPSIHSER